MPIETLTAASVLPTLLVVAKATAILLAAMLLAVALHRSSASTRHQVWLVALAGLLLLPAIATYAPLGIKVLPAPAVAADRETVATPPDGIRLDGASTQSSTGGATLPGDNAESTRSPDASRRIPIGTLLLGLWGAVALVLLLRLGAGVLAVRRIVRGAVRLDDEAWQESLLQIADRLAIEEPPALLRSDAIHMPFAAGMRTPMIVLPAECEGWSEAQRGAVLIHELGHVRRKDMIGHTLGRIACAIYWFHPLVWSAARRLRDASERACDDLAIRLGAVPSDYAQHLLDIVTKVRHPNTPTAAIAMARRKEFEGRMLAILDPSLRRADASRWRPALLSLGLAGFVVAVSAAAPARREVPPAPAPVANGDRPIAPPALPASSEAPAGDAARVATPQPSPTPAATGTDHAVADPLPVVDRLLRQYHVDLKIDLGDASAAADEKMDLLIRVLKSDSSARVRRVAAWGLQHYADEPAARTELARVLGSDGDDDVRRMAAWALSHSTNAAVATALRQALKTDTDAEVREMAAWGLGRQEDAASMEAVTAALSDPSPRVQGTAAWAIGQMQPKVAPSALVAMLKSEDAGNRLKAAWALSEIADKDAIPAIRTALDRPDNDAATSRALLRALVKSGTSTDDLSKFLSSANDELRLFAIKSLTGGGSVDPWPWPWPRPIPFP